MSQIAKAGIDQLIESVDVISGKAVDSVQALVDAGGESVQAAATDVTQFVTERINRANTLRHQLLMNLREAADAAADAIPAP